MPFVGQLEPESLLNHFLAHPPRGFSTGCLASGVPTFSCSYDILTTVEPQLRRRIERWPLQRYWRGWLRPSTRFVGSTVTEYAWLPSAVDPAAFARSLRVGEADRQPLLVIKDIPSASPLLSSAENDWAAAFADHCANEGFVIVEGQALAWVPIDFTSIDEYLARLSRNRRRDIRRKLRSRQELDVAIMCTGAAFDDDATVDDFYALYRNVYEQSEVHFDFLERGFFQDVLRDARSGGLMFVYRAGGRMIGWNLCFEYGGALVDKYMGLSYPHARDNNLYTVSWIKNLEYALRHGLERYVAGWTDPEVKRQLGAKFTFTRHAVYVRNRLLRRALRRVALDFESDRAWRERMQHP